MIAGDDLVVKPAPGRPPQRHPAAAGEPGGEVQDTVAERVDLAAGQFGGRARTRLADAAGGWVRRRRHTQTGLPGIRAPFEQLCRFIQGSLDVAHDIVTSGVGNEGAEVMP